MFQEMILYSYDTVAETATKTENITYPYAAAGLTFMQVTTKKASRGRSPTYHNK